MSLVSRLLGANPSIQVSTLLSGSLSTPSAKQAKSLNSYESIAFATATGGSGTQMEFTNIPQIYTNLRIVLQSATYDGNLRALLVGYNSDTSASYSSHSFYHNAGTTQSTNSTSNQWNSFFAGGTDGLGGQTDNWGLLVIDIFDYADTSKCTSSMALGGYVGTGTTGTQGYGCAIFTKTDAVTSIQLLPNYSSGWRVNSKAGLYGIRAQNG